MTALERHESLTGPPTPTGCRLWQGAIARNGYGAFKLNGKKVSAHRAALLLRGQQLATDVFVCHSCDNRRCVASEHLFLGTHRDNIDDAVRKDRYRNNGRKASQLDPFGVVEVLETVRRLGSMSAADRHYGTCHSTVRNYLERHGVNPRAGLFQGRR